MKIVLTPRDGKVFAATDLREQLAAVAPKPDTPVTVRTTLSGKVKTVTLDVAPLDTRA